MLLALFLSKIAARVKRSKVFPPAKQKKAPGKVLFCLVGTLTSDGGQPPTGGTSASLKCGRNLRFPHKRPLPDYGGQVSGEI